MLNSVLVEFQIVEGSNQVKAKAKSKVLLPSFSINRAQNLERHQVDDHLHHQRMLTVIGKTFKPPWFDSTVTTKFGRNENSSLPNSIQTQNKSRHHLTTIDRTG